MPAFTENWFRSKGFAEPPTYMEAKGIVTLYRVYGGVTSRIIGSCYSFTNPLTVTNAEFDLNIVKWGNLCLYVATFETSAGTPMYIGRIDQSLERKDLSEFGSGIIFGGNVNAQQVWIDPDRAITYLRLIGTPRRLIQDKVFVASPTKVM